MADIFNRQNVPVGGVFLSDKAIMTVSGDANLGVGALVQNVDATYTQQVSSVFELGSNKVYQMMGRALGNLTIGRIVGTTEFAEALFDNCKGGGTVMFQGEPGACYGVDPGTFNRTLTGVFITNYGFSMNTQELMIRENLQAVFSGMSK